MASLHLFGGASIEGGGGPLSAGATQRHRLALLALLALARSHGVARDKLVVYLWPERDVAHARNLLNQAVYTLRKALGESTIVSSVDELRLDADLLGSDVAAFEEALAAGDLERAVDLYSGPFLDGFFLPDAVEFERWADGERERLHRGYRSALERLAEEAGARGDLPRAVEWWHRLAGDDPYNARVTVSLMEALEAAGDRAAAIRLAGVHGHLLERDLEAEPDPAVETLARRMRTSPEAVSPAGGKREAGPLPPPTTHPPVHEGDGVENEAEPASVDRAGPAASTSPRATSRFPNWKAASLAGALALAYVIFVVPRPRPAGPTEPAPDAVVVSEGRAATRYTVAVLPFDDLSERDDGAVLAAGIHSDLITALSSVASLTVISHASVLGFRDPEQPLTQIGDELGADALLEGSVQRVRDTVRVHVRLSHASNGHLLWGESYDRELTLANIFAIQTDIAERIVASLEAALTPAERQRMAVPPTADLTAYEYLHQARSAFDGTRAGNEESERLLRLALELDPRMAPAWAALATAYGWRPPYLGFPISDWDSAAAFAERALEMDPGLADGHVALSLLYGHQGRLDQQEHAARAALERNPNSDLATRRLAESYRERGAFPQALRLHRESVRLSPATAVYRSWVGHVYADLGDYATAERWYRAVLSLHPDHMHALTGLTALQLHAGQRDSAIHRADLLVARYPDETLALVFAAMVAHTLRDFERVERYAGRTVALAPRAPVREAHTLLATTLLGFARLRAGDLAAAGGFFDRSLAFLEPMMAAGATTPRWPYEIALIHAARGDGVRAITWLETAYDRGFRWTWMLELDPMLDPLRGDPRFRGLVSRVRADVEEMRRRVEQESRVGSR